MLAVTAAITVLPDISSYQVIKYTLFSIMSSFIRCRRNQEQTWDAKHIRLLTLQMGHVCVTRVCVFAWKRIVKKRIVLCWKRTPILSSDCKIEWTFTSNLTSWWWDVFSMSYTDKFVFFTEEEQLLEQVFCVWIIFRTLDQ